MGRLCCVSGCKSLKTDLHHCFPSSVEKCLLWLDALKIKGLDHLPKEERIKYRVCGKHFAETDYIFSLKKRKLKDNAIPSLHIPSTRSIVNAESDNIDLPSSQRKIEDICDVREIQGLTKNIAVQVEENVMIKAPRRRKLLDSGIKEADLTPREKWLYNITKCLAKQIRYLKKQNMDLKKRIKYMLQSAHIRKIETLTQTQRLMIEMKLRTTEQSNQVSK